MKMSMVIFCYFNDATTPLKLPNLNTQYPKEKKKYFIFVPINKTAKSKK